VNLRHWMKKEKSGLAFTTLELVKAEEQQGHGVELREPNETVLYGGIERPDVHVIHSQIHPNTYHDRIPKLLWTHGEPLSSVGNGVSMRAIVDLAPLCEAFISMRQEEWAYWQPIKKTYVVPKGIDLERFKPLENVEMLSGEPAVLYCEHWRGQRNPLAVCVAMERVAQKYPKARLHLFNCTDQKMYQTFKALIDHARWATFIRTLQGPVADDKVNELYCRSHIVVSGLYPLYARSIEAFGAGRAFIGPGYRDPEYPWRCDLDPESMAAAIIQCWENYDQVNYRQWAERKHDVQETVRQSVAIYQRYL
jgi:glycosyltransferase involved in cell wall biosynthesis